MTDYRTDLADVVTNHRGLLQSELAVARQAHEKAAAEMETAIRRVHMLEELLSLEGEPPGLAARATQTPPPSGTGEQLTLHAAMHKVLKESPTGRLRAGEIIAEIERQGLYRMRDGRPPESQQIHARAGHYPEMFGKDGSYFFAK